MYNKEKDNIMYSPQEQISVDVMKDYVPLEQQPCPNREERVLESSTESDRPGTHNHAVLSYAGVLLGEEAGDGDTDGFSAKRMAQRQREGTLNLFSVRTCVDVCYSCRMKLCPLRSSSTHR